VPAIPIHPPQPGKPAYILACFIWLLSTARAVRLAGFLLLLVAFLVNCYFILFDQQSYIALLEHFSQDGKVSDINAVFFRVLKLIIYLYVAWILATNKLLIASIVESSKTTKQPNLHWRHKRYPYIIASIIWLLISYLPFALLDHEIIWPFAREDSFYEYSGFLWLLLTSISFFYLFIRENRGQRAPDIKRRRNIFFLLLGLLFFFGAGEEISWGQRIFNYNTPEVAVSNIQNEFNLHNMPLFHQSKLVHTKSGRDKRMTKTGITAVLAMGNMFGYFWFSFCVLIPILYIASIKTHKWLDKHDFPIAPIWIGLLFIINHLIYYQAIRPIVCPTGKCPTGEIREAAYSFLLFILALWFINHPSQKYGQGKKSSANG
jgi:hypothetical protein